MSCRVCSYLAGLLHKFLQLKISVIEWCSLCSRCMKFYRPYSNVCSNVVTISAARLSRVNLPLGKSYLGKPFLSIVLGQSPMFFSQRLMTCYLQHSIYLCGLNSLILHYWSCFKRIFTHCSFPGNFFFCGVYPGVFPSVFFFFLQDTLQSDIS